MKKIFFFLVALMAITFAKTTHKHPTSTHKYLICKEKGGNSESKSESFAISQNHDTVYTFYAPYSTFSAEAVRTKNGWESISGDTDFMFTFVSTKKITIILYGEIINMDCEQIEDDDKNYKFE